MYKSYAVSVNECIELYNIQVCGFFFFLQIVFTVWFVNLLVIGTS